MTDGTPIAYGALASGTPVCTRAGREFGTVEHVLQIPQEDLFDGIVVHTHDGLRFVDRDQILTITDRAVTCDLDDEQAAALPGPSGNEVFDADASAGSGSSLLDRYNRLFMRGRWKREKE